MVANKGRLSSPQPNEEWPKGPKQVAALTHPWYSMYL